VATAGADRVVLTDDNPRSEDPARILDEILAGAPGAEVVPYRAEAIRGALGAAGAHDVVVVAGKGHEQGQVFADRTLPFDDRELVRTVIAELGGAA
jgi:UDP-N-acetylmuramoyl-L-alanyl-D-glutamate--2,6-diaminopimelate ligase